MSSVRCALVAFSIMSSAAIAFAQEPTSRDRPERFLMLLKPGDKLEWTLSKELNGYRLNVVPESIFTKIVKDYTARIDEMKTLQTELNDKSRTDPPSDAQKHRLNNLRAAAAGISHFGAVTFVGQDYVAVASMGDWSSEKLIPAWNITQIDRSKYSKETK